jgi:hypothetical protein
MNEAVRQVLREALNWAKDQLIHVPQEEINERPLSIGRCEEWRDLPNIEMWDAPLEENEGDWDKGKSMDLAGSKVLFYVNVLFHHFLARCDRFWNTPLLVERIVPELEESEYLCGLIELTDWKTIQWKTYFPHLWNRFFDMGIATRKKDRRGLCWYRFTDKFLQELEEKGEDFPHFLLLLKKYGVKDSTGTIGHKGLGLPPAHSMLRTY